MRIIKSGLAALAVVGLTFAPAHADTRLQGAGSTFVTPMMQRWVTEYQK